MTPVIPDPGLTNGPTTSPPLCPSHYDPEFVGAVCADLDGLSRLPANWDGYGAPTIHAGIVAAARTFIKLLPRNIAFRPSVVPMSTGNLQFEWHEGRKVLELEFETAETIRYLQWHSETGVQEEDSFSTDNISKAVDLIIWSKSGTST